MKCEDAQGLKFPFLDSRLETKDALEVQYHLDGCFACRREFEIEANLYGLLGEKGLWEEPPAHLTRKVMEAVGRACGSPFPAAWLRRYRVPLAVAVAVLALSFLLAGRRGPPEWVPDPIAATVRDYEDFHAHGGPLTYAGGDRYRLQQALQQAVSFGFEAPDLSARAFEVQGGRICRLPAGAGIHLVYRRDGEEVAYYAFPDPGIDLGRHGTTPVGGTTAHLSTIGKFQVVFWKQDGLICTLVSDLPMEELVALAALGTSGRGP